MGGLNSLKVGVLAALVVSSQAAFAAPTIETLADDLATNSTCTQTLPDGTCADEPRTRQMVVPGAKIMKASVSRAATSVGRAIRRDISMTFLVGSAELSANAKATLDRFANRLVQVVSYRAFTVEGHTDRSGAADTNLALSKARAESVVSYLSAKGVDKNKMTARGYGFDKPLAGTPAESPRNRRVEVVAE